MNRDPLLADRLLRLKVGTSLFGQGKVSSAGIRAWTVVFFVFVRLISASP